MENALRGPTADTAAGDVVIITVSPDGPYGVNFVGDVDGFAAVIQSFDRLPNGKFGPLQKHGGLHYGDVLFEMNDTPLSSLSYNETMKIVNDRNILKKSFKFINSKEYYRRKKATSVRVPQQDLRNNFMSAIKRSRISENGGRKFSEFEIACQLIAVSTKVQKEIVYQWSVWKRFSEFESIHAAVKRTLGWQMDGIELPSSHTFVLNKLSPEFVELRRSELSDYWNKVLRIDKITDFHKHHCSLELKDFLQVEQNTRKGVAAAADMVDETKVSKVSSSVDPSGSGSAPTRRASVKSIRRKASSQTSGFNYDDEPPLASSVANSTSTSTTILAKEAPVPADKSLSPPATETNSPPPPPVVQKAPISTASAASAAPLPPTNKSNAPANSGSSQPPSSSGVLPPKASGARANLLGSIAALRKD